MKYFVILLPVCFLLHAEPTQQQFERVKNELLSLRVDETKIAAVNNIELARDAGKFSFSSGTLYAFSPVNGNVHALLFVGDGSFTCIPPTDVEKKQLLRFYEKEEFNEEIKSVFLLFNDSTFLELSKKINFVPANIPSDVSPLIKSALKFIQNEKRTSFDYDIFRQFLYNESNDFFYSHLVTRRNDPYFFSIDPYDIEEVYLQCKRESFMHDIRETICQFHVKKDYLSGTVLSAEKKPSMAISAYKMENTIRRDLEFSSRCAMTVRNAKSDRKWICVGLYEKFELDSVFIDGKQSFGKKEEYSDYVWIGMDEPFPASRDVTVTLYYHGEIIEAYEGWYSLKSSIGWYPRSTDERQYSTFDLTFHTPPALTFATIGKRQSYDTTESDITSHWILDKPFRNASFIIGNFSQYTISDSGKTLTLFLSKAHDATLKNYLASKMVLSGSHMEEQVSGDIANSIRLFQNLYGTIETNPFYIAEIPGTHGESFPGLIHLSWATFQNTEANGSDEVFRAHEVAHQWWASSVDFRTYHDQWLSEAFAEYSGLWYMQLIRHDNEKFFDMLNNYKKSILQNRNYIFGRGQEAGPIWLGYRTHSSKTGGDYDLIIYKKGAWVLHMLRNMAIDLRTLNEDLFKATMKDFYATFRGTQASTEDFRNIVEKHFGLDMSWFFNQWVYGTEIPTYSILYKGEELPNGKYKVHCTVRQKNVSDDFQMSVPFLIDFGNNQFARVRRLVKGPVTEIDFSNLPLKPQKIKFNVFESVLCDIEDEEWD